MLIDGSTHDWLEGRGPAFTLVGAIDDATGRILALAVREHEDLHGYLTMVGMVLGPHGRPLTFYGDRFGALIRNDDHWTLEEQLAGRQQPTQFGQLLEELGIAFIAAHSPQAKGRIERLWETLQDRLSSEIRLLGLTSSAQVEAYLPQFIAEFNARFAVPARERGSAWRAAPPQLERLLSCRYRRKVARDNTASIPGRWIQLPPRAHGRSWQGCMVEVRDASTAARWCCIRVSSWSGRPRPPPPSPWSIAKAVTGADAASRTSCLYPYRRPHHPASRPHATGAASSPTFARLRASTHGDAATSHL